MQPKLVYIDDEFELCDLIADCLRDAGFDVRAFVDADEAISSIAIDPPDVALIDYRLKDTNGLEVASKLDPKIKKILVTGELEIPSSTLFTKVVRKPLDVRTLIQAIQEQLS